MAINSMVIYNKIPSKSVCSSNSTKSRNLNKNSIVRSNCGTDCSITSKRSNKLKNNIDLCSPYLKDDKVQMVTQITDKRVVHRKVTDLTSSFPLAIKLYKASSDEFKLLKKANKKVRKSVLTLPNEPASVTQACTVSDMNDSEYYNREIKDNKIKTKKRLKISNKRKALRPKDYEYYDRDATYCSQFNIDLDCSSTDMIKRFDGDCHQRKLSNPNGEDFQAHDVWAVLRNINRFQFRSSPPLSDDSTVAPKKKKGPKRRNSRKDTRFIETCRTEKFAYISSFEVENKYPKTISRSSSCDRVTVIDNHDDCCEMYKEFEKRMDNSRNLVKVANNPRDRNQVKTVNKRLPRSRIIKSKENISLAIQNRLDELKQSEGHENLFRNSTDSSDTKNRHSTIAVLTSMSTENTIRNRGDGGQVHEGNEKLIYSINSAGSSKLGNNKLLCAKNEQDIAFPLSSDESTRQLKGITKVVLSKGQNMTLSKRNEMQKRKSPSTKKYIKPMSKTSLIGIKRKLDCSKIPIALAEKNQLTSPVNVNDYEALKFDGLDKHIWPSKIEWYKNDTKKGFNNGLSKDIESDHQRKYNTNTTDHKLREFNKEISHSKESTKKDIKAMLKSKVSSNEIKVESHYEKTQQHNKKQKPIRQFKDKMIKFLYKKPSSQSILSCRQVGVQCGVNNKDYESVKKVDKCTNTLNVKIKPIYSDSLGKSMFKPYYRQSKEVTSHLWSKTKWASDFIDNVLEKIRNGVYYNNENKSADDGVHDSISKYKETSTQAVLTAKNSSTLCEEDFNDNPNKSTSVHYLDPLRVLGFDANIPALEIETFEKNKISIKHCMTNVTLEFHVVVPDETNNVTMKLHKSPSLVPIDDVIGRTKLFQHKITILNAMLPAELCSIIPNMIRNIIKTQTEEILSHELFTITELSRKESPTFLQSFSVTHIGMSSEIRRVLCGTFSKTSSNIRLVPLKAKSVENNTEYHHTIELLPNLRKTIAANSPAVPKVLISLKKSETDGLETRLRKPISAIHILSTTALVPYSASKHSIIETSKRYEFSMTDIIQNYYKYNAGVSLNSSLHFLNCSYDRSNNNVSLNFNVMTQGIENHVNVTITNLKLDSLYKNISCNKLKVDGIDTSVMKSIEYFENLSSKVGKKNSRSHNIKIMCKNKKKPFVKLFRKCNSTTNITALHCTCSLSTILNIEDFSQLIGSKSLASVFDNYAAKKILSSLLEMKNWISEINSRQALLIILLTNKKDTPNLVQFRPLLLQGIAVNRITRASELDMEIEVIERENMNNLSRYEGISYLPASVENQDNLLEELYWIAKTTASDYQRSFDESSENLLKSLLKKRKKLNPSYLRVMARYVGLGLLKSRIRN